MGLLPGWVELITLHEMARWTAAAVGRLSSGWSGGGAAMEPAAAVAEDGLQYSTADGGGTILAVVLSRL